MTVHGTRMRVSSASSECLSRVNSLCTGTIPLSADLNLSSGSIETVRAAPRKSYYQLLSPALAGGGGTRASKAVAAAAKLTLSRVLVDVSRDGFASNDVLGDAVLIHSHRRQNRQGARIDLGTSVRDDADHDCAHHKKSPRASSALDRPTSRARSLPLTHPFSSHRRPRSYSGSARTSAGCSLCVQNFDEYAVRGKQGNDLPESSSRKANSHGLDALMTPCIVRQNKTSSSCRGVAFNEGSERLNL